MGNQKTKWTSEEEEALKAGVTKHGVGKWKNILKDPEFAPFLTIRSNIDLKDKWRNMGISTGVAQGSDDKSRFARVRPVTATAPAIAQSSLAMTSVAEDEVTDYPSKSRKDGKNAPKYSEMIFEALSSMRDSNASDLGAIVGFIETRHEVPQNFRRLLSSTLRRLVLQGKLERVQNCYKLKDAALQTNVPTPKQKELQSRPTHNSVVNVSIQSIETIEEAARTAAYKVVDAENKSFVAAEAVKEAERVSKMAEDAELMLQLVKDIYEQCLRGETVLLA